MLQTLHTSSDFAILAPVPEEHLESGAPVAEATGYVALGNDKPDVFEEIDALREGAPVPVLFYASHGNNGAKNTEHRATWTGWYIGHLESNAEKRHPLGDVHRPPSTANDGAWTLFYHVVGLRKLLARETIALTKLEKYKTPGEFRADARVRGVGLVRLAAA